MAIATPPGVGAVGLIRVSGPSAWRVVEPLIEGGSGWNPSSTPRRLRRVRIRHPDTRRQIDDALVAFMPGPHTYTGEDVIEISCHGNPALLSEIINGLVAQGARLAEPGEFTRRAYLNDRIDLVQAEGVALLIEARTSRAAELAIRQVEGDLSGALADLRVRVLDLIAELEVALDFPDEGYGASVGVARVETEGIRKRLGELLDDCRRGRVAYTGVSVVIAGAPNVGKSSLLNALLGRDRAIVSATPGTTRDLVEGSLTIEGIQVRLVDGAGIGTPKDALDAEGMARSRRAIAEGDLVVVLLDSSRTLDSSDKEVLTLTADRPRLLVASKSDLCPRLDLDVDCVCTTFSPAGMEAVVGKLGEWVKRRTGGDAEEGGIVVSLRVSECLEAARAAVDRALAGLATEIPLEAALVDLREVQDALDSATGTRVSDQVLDRIFARFCVGK